MRPTSTTTPTTLFAAARLPLIRLITLAAVAACVTPVSARAQAPSAYATFVPSATVVDANLSLGLTGAFGVRFNRAVAFELELTAIPDLIDAPDYRILANQLVLPSIYPAPRIDIDGRAVMFLTNARISMPTTLTRVTPFLVAGGGLAHVRQNVAYAWAESSWTTSSIGGIGLPTDIRSIGSGTGTYVPDASLLFLGPSAYSSTSAELALALNLGGGVDISIGKGLSVDVDFRHYRLMGARDRNLGRFGIGASYRF
jgi:hypothetical protein